MPTELPIACTLSREELPRRLAEMRAIGAADLDSSMSEGRRAVLRFRRGTATRDRLEAIVAAESECCAFLDFALTGGEAGLLLTIDAPAGGEPVLAEMVAAFSGGVSAGA